MSDLQKRYTEVKDELMKVADPLFGFATEQVLKQGAFLPFAAVLAADGQVALVAAAPEREPASGEDVLPLLVAGLQQSAAREDVTAAAACEWVKIGLNGGKLQHAVKVHAHHRRGVAVTFYLPATKPLLRKWQFGEMIMTPAPPLIEAWPNADEG